MLLNAPYIFNTVSQPWGTELLFAASMRLTQKSEVIELQNLQNLHNEFLHLRMGEHNKPPI